MYFILILLSHIIYTVVSYRNYSDCTKIRFWVSGGSICFGVPWSQKSGFLENVGTSVATTLPLPLALESKSMLTKFKPKMNFGSKYGREELFWKIYQIHPNKTKNNFKFFTKNWPIDFYIICIKHWPRSPLRIFKLHIAQK